MNKKNIKLPAVLGGLGNKNSNNGKQFFQQDRVYDGRGEVIALCLPSGIPGGSYRYLFEESK